MERIDKFASVPTLAQFFSYITHSFLALMNVDYDDCERMLRTDAYHIHYYSNARLIFCVNRIESDGERKKMMKI